jgi:hypothetical protein
MFLLPDKPRAESNFDDSVILVSRKKSDIDQVIEQYVVKQKVVI